MARSDCVPASLRSRHPGSGPGPTLPHCGRPTHRDRALGQRKRPLPSGPIGSSISRGLSAAGFLAWVIKTDRGRPLQSATVTASSVSTSPAPWDHNGS